MKHIISLIVICSILLSVFAITVFASNVLYVTNKADVPVWSEASSKSTQIRKLAKGTLATKR